MSDLIKRSDAIEAVREYAEEYTFNSYHKGMLKAVSIITAVPSADRPQGEWHFDEKGNFFCSECKSYPRSQYATTDFCPNCGAKMNSPWVLKGADDE